MNPTWKRSTRCSSNGCIEVGVWNKSTFSDSFNSCVETTVEARSILVRDSKNPDLQPLSFQRSEWMNTVLAPVMLGRLPSFVRAVPDGFEWHGHTVDGDSQVLRFTAEEWEAFTEGVKAGEFNLPPAGAGVRGSGANGPNGNGMGPRPDRGQPFGDYRLPWGPRG